MIRSLITRLVGASLLAVSWCNSASGAPVASFEIHPTPAGGVVGAVPVVVQFDASKSISGTWSTNDWYGIQQFTWDFGDGSVIPTREPTLAHTYLWPGAFTVTLTTVNSSGLRASSSRTLQVVDATPSMSIYHVMTNGNDATGDGSYGKPWRTITKAVGLVSAGDYVAVHQGTYSEYVDVNRNVGTKTSRVTVIGYGARCGGVKIRCPNWTWEGFDMDYSPPDPADAVVYIFRDADNTWIANNHIHDTPEGIYGVEGLSPGGFGPMDGSLNVRVVNNTFTNIGHIVVQLFNGSNWVIEANQVCNTWGEGDFVRPMGVNHTISRNYCSNLNNGATGGHADFLQIPVPGSVWVKNILVEGNMVVGLTNLTVDSGAITCTKAAGDNPIVASAPIFNSGHNQMTLWLHTAGTYWRITNVLSSTEVEVSSSNAISIPDTFYLTADDAAIAQMASAHDADPSYTNIVFRNNIFWRVRGLCSDSIDGLKFYNNLFYDTPRVGGNVTAGGGVNGSSYGTEFYNNIFYNVSKVANNAGWYYNAQGGDQASNTTVIADYNAVYPAKQSAPPNDVFHWAVTGTEANGVNGSDPLFVDAAHGGFRLVTNSPLLGMGKNLSGVFSNDFLTLPRPASGSWTIGPFQASVPRTSVVVVSPPSNLRIISAP